eukprot:g524.t1
MEADMYHHINSYLQSGAKTVEKIRGSNLPENSELNSKLKIRILLSKRERTWKVEGEKKEGKSTDPLPDKFFPGGLVPIVD